jgi:PTH1 family peptidyl-tRNA hydrolase
MAIDALAREHGFSPARKRFQSEAMDGLIEHEGRRHKVLALKPQTYMNESGRAVGEAMRYFDVALEDVILFYDELDLAPGKVKVKTGGGAAGHNGIRSTIAHCGADFRRVRIGIGHPGSKDKVTPWVLGDFAKADRDWLAPLLDAMARSAGHLAARDDPGFMTKVAHLTQPARPKKPKPADDRGGSGGGAPDADGP